MEAQYILSAKKAGKVRLVFRKNRATISLKVIFINLFTLTFLYKPARFLILSVDLVEIDPAL
jgi:hypothetical protein